MVPILAGSASYALSETFGLRPGLYKKPSDAKGFYGIIALATLVGVITNFTGIPPFKMLYYTAVLNGLCAPILMAIIILIGNNAQIMGPHINSAPCRILGWLITGIMGLSGILLIISFGS